MSTDLSASDSALGAILPLPADRTVEVQIARRLRRLISTGELRPGARLPLRQLAERFGVSVTPVRIALRDLAAEGYVEAQASGGVRVRALSREEFEEVWTSRTGMESWLARCGVAALGATELTTMTALLDHLRRRVRVKDQAGYLEEVWTYRRVSYLAAGRPRLLEAVTQLHERSARYNALTLTGDRLQRSFAFMQDYHRACRARDGEAAQATLRASMDWTMDFVLARYEDDLRDE